VAPSASNVAASSFPTLDLPQIGRPFDAEDIRDMMESSRRPGGVPVRVQNPAVAQKVADSIWTYRSAPWKTSSVGGFCGPDACTLELAGTAPGASGEDLWVFEVTEDAVTLVTAELRALPHDLIRQLDALARREVADIQSRGLALASTSWLSPPSAGRFRLSYRAGAEEGSCRIDVTLAVIGAMIAESATSSC
jgi:hypothetical protein